MDQLAVFGYGGKIPAATASIDAIARQDAHEWQKWAGTNGGQSSGYNFNHDGMTDNGDREIIGNHMGMACLQ